MNFDPMIILRLFLAYVLFHIIFFSWDWFRDKPDEWYDDHPEERTWKDTCGDILTISIPIICIIDWTISLCS